MIAPVLIVVAATMLLAQKAPELSGTWVLNTAKSQNIGMMAALKDTIIVTQTARDIVIHHVTSFQGQAGSRDVRYTFDGTTGTNDGPMGDRNDTVSKWVGQRLVTTWTKDGAVAGTKAVMTETLSVSPDGKTLTFESVRGANAPVVMVFDKQ